MAKLQDITVGFDIESVVKLACFDNTCRFNENRDASCRLKRINIDKGGVCRLREELAHTCTEINSKRCVCSGFTLQYEGGCQCGANTRTEKS